MKYNLCIDLGNTRAKWSLFQPHLTKPDIQGQCDTDAWAAHISKLLDTEPVKNCILSAVVHVSAEDKAMLAERTDFFIELNDQTRLPFINAYSSADTLGPDRLALAAGALALQPNKASMVISLGTCITYNLILANRFFRGGAISPGLRMRFEALHTLTDKLPLVTTDGDIPALGYNTETSIRSGVVHGIVAEIEGMCRLYAEELKDDFNPILTGGDLPFLEPRFKNKIFAAPDILMIGLHEILKANVPLF